MMGEQYAEMVRRWVRWLRPEAPPRLPSDRRRLVSAVEEALRARRRQRVTVRWTAGVSAAAAAGLVVWLGVTNPAWRAFAPGSVAGSLPSTSGAPAAASAETGAREAGARGHVAANGMPMRAGLEVTAPASSEVRIDGGDGTALVLEPGGSLAVLEAGVTRRFELRRGAVRAKVAKLLAGERFIIDTVDAEIEVHGTAFRVALVPADPTCGDGSRTRVSVTEGIVSVRPSDAEEVRLRPGDAWPGECLSAPAAAERPAPPAVEPPAVSAVLRPAAATRASPPRRLARRTPELKVAVLEERAPPARASGAVAAMAPAARGSSPAVAAPLATAAVAGTGAAEPIAASARRFEDRRDDRGDSQDTSTSTSAPALAPPAAKPQSASALRAQNDMFAAAVRAKKRGRAVDAAKLFAALVHKYPESPLAESALAQRMKLLADTDPWSAAEAATEYLTRFPGGFARADARRLAASATPAARP